jgi:nucleotide-binding universal stress UspA family protein
MTPLPARVRAIVVPLDGSTFSERALPVAARLARRLDAEVHLLSTVAKEDDVDEREAELGAIDLPGLVVHRSVVVDLDPAGEIHETLRRLGDAVACMASHGRGASAAFVGSVASEVLGRGHDPVILVGPLVDLVEEGQGIFACVDEKPASAAIVPIALCWGQRLGEATVVATVAEPVPEPVRPAPVHRVIGPDGDVEEFLETLVAPYRQRGHELSTVAIYDPVSAAQGVSGYLKEHPAALAVAGARTRAVLTHYVVGAATAGIVYYSPSPVLAVPLPRTGEAR